MCVGKTSTNNNKKTWLMFIDVGQVFILTNLSLDKKVK